MSSNPIAPSFYLSIKAKVVAWKDELLVCSWEEPDHSEIQVSTSRLFHPYLVKELQRLLVPNTVVRLNECVLKQGVYYPLFFVMTPDYLLDVTSISESLQDQGSSRLHYLQSKLSTMPNSQHILLGNLANQIVDEMVSIAKIEDYSFQQSIQNAFRASAVQFAKCKDLTEDAQVQVFTQAVRAQATHIKYLFETEKAFKHRSDITLEPSFISEFYGLQGRMDILVECADKTHIIELKSGRAASVDHGAPKVNHLSQLMMYYVLYASAHEKKIDQLKLNLKGSVMYSKSAELNEVKIDSNFIQIILHLRNQIVDLEQRIINEPIPKLIRFFRNLNPQYFLNTEIDEMLHHISFAFDRGHTFSFSHWLTFCQTYRDLDTLSLKYFCYYIKFISTEQYMSKVGHIRHDHIYGHSSFWQLNKEDKKAQYDVIYDLQIVENTLNTSSSYITLKRTNPANKFVNFREGDMCILYPNTEGRTTQHRLFKGYISHLSLEMIRIHFRHIHNDISYFDRFETWCIERDYLDSSYRSMTKQLFGFVSSSSKFKPLLLGLESPNQNLESPWTYHNTKLSEEQNRILTKALSAKDYFILNGPPGTGKTSIIIHHLVKELALKTAKTIYVLTYTNRAADELCASVSRAIQNIKNQKTVHYMRLGSQSNCDPRFKEAMIQQKLAQLELSTPLNRQSVLQLLADHQVVISTVSSFQNNLDLIDQPDDVIMIVDEASQILEPQIVHILNHSSKCILIGDHKQLPAISQQNIDQTRITDLDLNKIGLLSTSNSLFERLYTLCETNGWHHAYDGLTYQGRMHQDIMSFVNTYFYNSKLKLAYSLANLDSEYQQELRRQIQPLELRHDATDTIDRLLATKRMLFIDTASEPAEPLKSSPKEARMVIDLIERLQALYADNNRVLIPFKQIGIITPFRSQIALIKELLEVSSISNHNDILVDTVERFQGSQKEIIILSMVVNHQKQLSAISNLDIAKKVDRKLNVALSRAKHQVIILGNRNVLSSDPLYKALLQSIEQL